MAELELRIREIYDLVERRKDYVYTAPEMLEVIRNHVAQSSRAFFDLKYDLEEEQANSDSLQDDIDALKDQIDELEQELSELEG